MELVLRIVYQGAPATSEPPRVRQRLKKVQWGAAFPWSQAPKIRSQKGKKLKKACDEEKAQSGKD